MWPEVEAAKRDNKRELNLTGAPIAQRLNDSAGALDASIFDLSALNLLSIADTGALTALPARLSNLTNLQQLLLYGNRLAELPAAGALAALRRLKTLDVSRNELQSLPDEIGTLEQLFTLNASQNRLRSFPALAHCVRLSSLDLSNNQLTEFPPVCDARLANLSELVLDGNAIGVIPAEIAALEALKRFAMRANRVQLVPKVLGKMGKLKEILLIGNPIKDKRLLKLIDQCHSNKVLAYIAANGANVAPKVAAAAAAADADDTAAPIAAIAAAVPAPTVAVAAAAVPQHTLIVRKAGDFVLHYDAAAVSTVRPYILCCILRDVRFPDAAAIRAFLAIQQRLHDGVCRKREASAIATHDLARIGGSYVRYTARLPDLIRIVPLRRQREMTASEYYAEQKAEAEHARKQRKASSYAGVHKYLHIVEKYTDFPLLEDGAGLVVSLAPLTNCEQTKITEQTRDILVEVSAGSKAADAHAAMERLLEETLLGGFGGCVVEGAEAPAHRLIVEQVRCVEAVAQTRRAPFPDRTDLGGIEARQPTIRVQREL